MLPPVQPQIPGFEECAAIVLRALLMPDGRLSHWEIEARDPAGTLVYFSATGDGAERLDESKRGEVLVRFSRQLDILLAVNRHASETS